MARVVVALALGLIGIALLIVVAPFLFIAALGFLLLAWKRPSAAKRVSSHPRLARVPELVRATPMRLASVLLVGTFVLGTASVAISEPSADAAGASEPTATPEIARDEPADTATPTPTERPTPEPTRRPTPPPTPSPTPEPRPVLGAQPSGPTEVATVASVTDGDTIRVLLDGQNVPVRYIGIDTPETQNSLEWMGPEASTANAALVAGQQVVLEKDVSETDQYGRLLRYVWLEQDTGWLLVNLELVRQGFASVTTYPPDVKYADALFLPAQQQARDAGRGLWGAAPTPQPTAAPIVPLVPQAPSNCEPSYPGICIPIGSADLDCGEIQWRRFAVRWDVANPDPHGFDGNADGVGCES